jgi:diguanylate cyclase (GGDEF)-like protein
MPDTLRHPAVDILSGRYRMDRQPLRVRARVAPLARALRRVPRAARDPYVAYGAGLGAVAAMGVAASREWRDLGFTILLACALTALQIVVGLFPKDRRPRSAVAWSLMRLSIPLTLAALVDFVGGPDKPYAALYLPVVAAAGAIGVTQGSVVAALAALVYLAPELQAAGASDSAATRGITLAGVALLLAIGTRRMINALEVALAELARLARRERRRARQIAGIEAISRVLVGGGTTSELLERVIDILGARFGFGHGSIYLADGNGRLQLTAHRGHEAPIPTFDGTSGIIGRAWRTRSTVHVRDVSRDPDYVAVDTSVVSEVCAPLIVNGEALGVLNVESPQPLDRTDRDLITALAGRIATVVALNRERAALESREALFRALNTFTQSVSRGLGLDAVAEQIVGAAAVVVDADGVALALHAPAEGRLVVKAVHGGERRRLGEDVGSDSLLGRAVADRHVVLEADPPARAHAAAVPIVHEGVVTAALEFRRTPERPAFGPIDRQGMQLIATQAGLVLANALLHREVEELAVRDPLTGLYNRRYFDEALDRLLADWRRSRLGSPRPLSAIVFDLDQFGAFNKLHGHQVGDHVLRTFADVLRSRFRASDLVARLGGEEFVVVLDGASREDAMEAADEVRTRLERRRVTDEAGEELSITVSAGCSALDPAHPTREALLGTADVALFMAKRAGRNTVAAA